MVVTYLMNLNADDKKQHGLISHMNDEKLDRIECSKPVEPVMISNPLPKRSGNKRPNNGIDKNKKPAKKPETKKHRAKVAVESKPKKMTKLSTPNEKRKCVKKATTPKRKYVKKALPIGRSQESSVTEDHKEVAEYRRRKICQLMTKGWLWLVMSTVT